MEIDQIIQGDCLEVLKTFPDNSIDAIITDPPYEIGFLGKSWDKTGIAHNVEMWKECLRVLKPGGHLLSFGGTRTYHRMASAIEDAGFEIRDMIEWVYGLGFPKSLNIGKQIDKMQGNEREVTGYEEKAKPTFYSQNVGGEIKEIDNIQLTKGTSEWEGWGTALKPAHEPICMARKPLAEKTVVENCLKWGTGGINIDESRVGTDVIPAQKRGNAVNVSFQSGGFTEEHTGRFPANLIRDGSDEVKKCFPITIGTWGKNDNIIGKKYKDSIFQLTVLSSDRRIGESGPTFRYFKSCPFEEEDFKSILYKDKADKKERNEGISGEVINNHPTVKPVALMCYLINMITRPHQIVLDPFLGSGTTAVACKKLYRHYIGIEINPEYIEIAKRRIDSFTTLDFKE